MEAVAVAHEAGLATRCVTSAHWAVNPGAAAARLSELRRVGLDEINISCDDLHQESVPLERVLYAYEAALELGLVVAIVSVETRHPKITREWLVSRFTPPEGAKSEVYLIMSAAVNVGRGASKLRGDELLHGLERGIRDADLARSFVRPETQYMFRLLPGQPGRGKDPPSQARPDPRFSPCPHVLRSPAVTPYGTLLACCGVTSLTLPVLVIGDTYKQSLESLMAEAGDDLILNWLAQQGPTAIASYLWSVAPKLEWLERIPACAICAPISSAVPRFGGSCPPARGSGSGHRGHAESSGRPRKASGRLRPGWKQIDGLLKPLPQSCWFPRRIIAPRR